IICIKAFDFPGQLHVNAHSATVKQVIPTASQCKIGTYVERDIHTPEEKYEVFGHWCRRFYRLSYRATPDE
ncbi:hypothetical protein QUH53_24625, partial [Klebsiella quasipneumoniae subsp. similipneumoniae]|uniref:hypothetical protein n=1 Tax=Klebsiella quasipneumoniae TaxID=1463165 RepID=UPI0025A1E878